MMTIEGLRSELNRPLNEAESKTVALLVESISVKTREETLEFMLKVERETRQPCPSCKSS